MGHYLNYLALWGMAIVIILLLTLPAWATAVLIIMLGWLLIDVARKLAE